MRPERKLFGSTSSCKAWQLKGCGQRARAGRSTSRSTTAGALTFPKNSVEHKRTEHIDIRYHFVREAITTDKVTLEHCATDEMVADSMTKEFGNTKHDKHVEAMGLC